MSADSTDAWGAFSTHLRDRMHELRISQAGIQSRGGPSPATLRAILNRRATALSPSKRRDLERALEWTHGSIDNILEGGHPTVATDPTPSRPTAPAPADETPEKPAPAANLVAKASALASEALQNIPAGSHARPHVANAIAELEGALAALYLLDRPWPTPEPQQPAPLPTKPVTYDPQTLRQPLAQPPAQ